MRVKYEDAADAENDEDSNFVIIILEDWIRFDCALVEVIVEEDRVNFEEVEVLEFMVDTAVDDGMSVTVFGWFNWDVNAVLGETFILRQLFEIKVGVK